MEAGGNQTEPARAREHQMRPINATAHHNKSETANDN